MVTFICPSCGKRLAVPDTLIGQAGRCASCKEKYLLTADMVCDSPPRSGKPAEQEEVERSPAGNSFQSRNWGSSTSLGVQGNSSSPRSRYATALFAVAAIIVTIISGVVFSLYRGKTVSDERNNVSVSGNGGHIPKEEYMVTRMMLGGSSLENLGKLIAAMELPDNTRLIESLLASNTVLEVPQGERLEVSVRGENGYACVRSETRNILVWVHTSWLEPYDRSVSLKMQMANEKRRLEEEERISKEKEEELRRQQELEERDRIEQARREAEEAARASEAEKDTKSFDGNTLVLKAGRSKARANQEAHAEIQSQMSAGYAEQIRLREEEKARIAKETAEREAAAAHERKARQWEQEQRQHELNKAYLSAPKITVGVSQRTLVVQ